MNKLNPEITFVFFVKNCLRMLFLLPIWFIFVSVSEHYLQINSVFFDAVGALLLLGFVLLGYFWAWLTYTTYSYELGSDKLQITRGVLIRKSRTIPYKYISTVEYFINPIVTKIFGLYNLHIETRLVSNSDGVIARASKETIPGLTRETAEQIKGALIRLSHQPLPERTFFNRDTGRYQ